MRTAKSGKPDPPVASRFAKLAEVDDAGTASWEHAETFDLAESAKPLQVGKDLPSRQAGQLHQFRYRGKRDASSVVGALGQNDEHQLGASSCARMFQDPPNRIARMNSCSA